MRVLATHGGEEVEAEVVQDGDSVTVRIGATEHRFHVHVGEGGRIEVEGPDGEVHLVEVVGTDLRVSGMPFPLALRKAPPKVEGAMRGAGGASGATTVKPPMPGKIAKVAVSAGDRVQAGDVLVILEAMKMQNEVVSPVAGTVRSVEVKEGESIDARRVICTIDPDAA